MAIRRHRRETRDEQDESRLIARLEYQDDLDDILDETEGFLPGAARVARIERLRECTGRVDGATVFDRPCAPRADNESHDSRARRWGGLVALTAKQWRAVLLAFGNACAYCLRDAPRLTLDHVIALRRGGDHAIWNVVPACASCNASKATKDLDVWCAQVGYDATAVRGRIRDVHERVARRFGDRSMRPSLQTSGASR